MAGKLSIPSPKVLIVLAVVIFCGVGSWIGYNVYSSLYGHPGGFQPLGYANWPEEGAQQGDVCMPTLTGTTAESKFTVFFGPENRIDGLIANLPGNVTTVIPNYFDALVATIMSNYSDLIIAKNVQSFY